MVSMRCSHGVGRGKKKVMWSNRSTWKVRGPEQGFGMIASLTPHIPWPHCSPQHECRSRSLPLHCLSDGEAEEKW